MIKLNKQEKKEKLDYFYHYLKNSKNNSNATLSEVDPNSNVSSLTIANLSNEFYKAESKQINSFIWEQKISKLFDDNLVSQFENDYQTDVIYLHDLSSSVPLPYCVAIDLTPFIEGGTKVLSGTSKAPRHLSSFCGQYVNLMFEIASGFAGAIADVSMLTYFDYFARKDYGENYLETNKKEIEQYLQLLIYTINEPAGGRGFQAIFYNTSIFDENYWKSLFANKIMPDYSLPNWESVNKLQWFFMDWFNKERNKELLTFPVITCAYLIDTETRIAKDKEFLNKMTDEMSKGNSFFIYSSDSVDSLASCCRLRNELDLDKNIENTKDNTFSYTLGGTGIQTGSKKVITINFNRLGQTLTNLQKNDFILKGNDYCISKIKEVLEPLVERIHKYLTAYNEILYDEYNAGILKAYSAGFISLEKQYLTLGVNGLVELAEYLGYTINDNVDYKIFLKEILKFIKELNKKDNTILSNQFNHKIRFNTEFVPAESLGCRNAKKDKESNLYVPRDCYNSYFYIVEDNTIDIFDKANLYSSDILENLDGGSAYHMNLDMIPDKEQWEMIVNYLSKVGCNYWCYNVLATCCENPECGYINKNTETYCVKCGSNNITYASRVIGYLTKISAWSIDRQKEGGLRYYHNINAINE